MSGETRTALVQTESTTMERVASAVVGLGFLSFVVSFATIFQWIAIDDTIAGLAVTDWYAVDLLAMGLVVLAFGAASRLGLVQTEPSDAAGLIPGVIFGLIGIGTGYFVFGTWFGLAPLLAFGAGLVLGGAALAVTIVPREDVGSTVVPGTFLLVIGGLIVADVLTLGWEFNPEWWSLTFAGNWVIPITTAIVSLLAIWSAAKARGGFGTSGRQSGAFMLISMNAFAMLAVLALLVSYTFQQGISTVMTGANPLALQFPFITNVTGGIFVDVPGVLPAIMGTLWLVVGAVLFAVPLGVGAALFLTEYADQGRFTSLVEIATNGLWSTPSIVYGLFGLAFLIPRFGDTTNLLSGQLVLGFMLLPLVLITAREAILAVPKAHRDASAALGVTKWETIKSVVLPSAAPGIVTGVILGVGRIAGETAPILLTIRASQFPQSTPDVIGSFRFTSTPPFVANDALLQGATALPLQLFATITAGQSPGSEVFTFSEFGWGVALVLLFVVLGLYAIGIASRIYFRRKLSA